MRGQRHALAAPYPRERPGTHCTGSWWAPGPVWTGAENLAPPGFDPRTAQPVGSRKIFLIITNIQQDISTNLHTPSRRVPFLCQITIKFVFSR